MPICPTCNQVVSDEENFCNVCGAPIIQKASEQQTPNEQETENDKPVLMLPNENKIVIDESHHLVGRADLAEFSEEDSQKISRGHFTVFLENGKCYVEDGVTKVQCKPSEEHTFLNDEDITGKKKKKLADGDILKVSDVEIRVKMS